MSDPRSARSIDDLTQMLRHLRSTSGEPSYAELARRVAQHRSARGVSRHLPVPAKVTVYDAFRTGRRRLDIDLVVDLVAVLGRPTDVPLWREAYARLVRERSQQTARPRVRALARSQSTHRLEGRHEEIALLADVLLDHEPSSGPQAGPAEVRTVLVTGLPGVGKTALGRAVAQRVHAALPASLLVIAELRTASGDEAPRAASPDVVLADVITELGRDPARAPRPEPTQPDPVVLLLDDVTTAADLAPVASGLPPGSRVVATSRRNLEVPGTTTCALRPLDDPAAFHMLRAALGRRGRADDVVLERLATHSGGIPLAIEVLAGQIDAQPQWELSDHLHRLEQRAGSGLHQALTSAYDALDEVQRLVLRLVALHPARLTGEEIEVLAGSDDTAGRSRTQHALEDLVSEHLLVPGHDARHDLHDTVRALAAARSAEEDAFSWIGQRVAVLAHHLTLSARTRARVIAGAARVADASGDRPQPPSGDVDDAWSWFDAHVEVLVTTAQLAGAHGLPDHVSALAAELFDYLQRSQRHHDAALVLEAEAEHGLPEGRVRAARLRAGTLAAVGRGEEASVLLRRMLDQDVADSHGLWVMLAFVDLVRGAVGEAMTAAHAGVAASRAAGDREQELHARGSLGQALSSLGRLQEAREETMRALRLAQEDSRGVSLAILHTDLARLDEVEGDRAGAIARTEIAVQYADAVHHPGLATYARFRRAALLAEDGGDTELSALLDTVAALREVDRRHVLCEALVALGRVHRIRGELPEAQVALEEARELAVHHGLLQHGAEGMLELARVARARGDEAEGRSLAARVLEEAEGRDLAPLAAEARLVLGS